MESGEQSFPRCASLPCGGKCGAPLAVGRRVSQGAAWRSPAGKMCRAPWRQGTETLVSHVEDFFPFPPSKKKEKGKEAPTTSPALGRAVRAGKGRSALCWRLSPAAAGAARPGLCRHFGGDNLGQAVSPLSFRFPVRAVGTRARLCEVF